MKEAGAELRITLKQSMVILQSYKTHSVYQASMKESLSHISNIYSDFLGRKYRADLR